MFSWMRRGEARSEGAAEREMTAEALKAALDAGTDLLLLDVRQPMEHAGGAIPGAVLIPLTELGGRLSELDRGREIVVYCHSGMRSALACAQLRRAGFEHVRNLRGGMMAWGRVAA